MRALLIVAVMLSAVVAVGQVDADLAKPTHTPDLGLPGPTPGPPPPVPRQGAAPPLVDK